MSLRDILNGMVRSRSQTRTAVRPSPEPSRFFARLAAVERELWFLAISAMLVDVTLTVHGLHIGLRELNPIGRAAFETAGPIGLYFLKAVALALGLCCRVAIGKRFGSLVPLGLAIPSCAAVMINSTLILYVSL